MAMIAVFCNGCADVEYHVGHPLHDGRLQLWTDSGTVEQTPGGGFRIRHVVEADCEISPQDFGEHPFRLDLSDGDTTKSFMILHPVDTLRATFYTLISDSTPSRTFEASAKIFAVIPGNLLILVSQAYGRVR